MQDVINILESLGTISDAAKVSLQKRVVKKECPKNHLLLKEGKICRHLYFITQGCARSFYYKDGKEITSWFAFETDAVTSMYSFVSQKPSFENIEILEESVLYAISFDNLQKMYLEYPEFNLIGRLFTEKYYIELEERVMSLQFLTAKERYQKLLAQQPMLLQRVTLGQVASYLGITQETLSRIRGKF
jgi:CRP/FNR family transcriptional regulator, anaerobic regulatory protein